MMTMRLIDADSLMKALNGVEVEWYMDDHGVIGDTYDTSTVVDIIAAQPTIEAEPVKHGWWEEKFFTNDRQRVCSVCHCTARQPSYDKGETALFNYCPNCGAKMDGGST